MTQNNIPNFSHLYGELETGHLPDALHCERLEKRSGFHDWKIKPHRHDQLEQVFAILTGGGTANIDGKKIQFTAPFVMFIPSLTVHEFQYDKSSTGFVLSAFKDELSNCLSDQPSLIPLFSKPLLMPTNNAPSIDAAIDQISNFHDEYRAKRHGRTVVLRSLLSLILINLSRSESCAEHFQNNQTDKHQAQAVNFLELLEEHYTQEHSTQFYAKAMNTTSTKLRDISQSILGVSAHQMIINKLVLEAKRNILYTSMSANQISIMLGFKDPAYFSRFFKKHAGESPSQYRRRA